MDRANARPTCSAVCQSDRPVSLKLRSLGDRRVIPRRALFLIRLLLPAREHARSDRLQPCAHLLREGVVVEAQLFQMTEPLRAREDRFTAAIAEKIGRASCRERG